MYNVQAPLRSYDVGVHVDSVARILIPARAPGAHIPTYVRGPKVNHTRLKIVNQKRIACIIRSDFA